MSPPRPVLVHVMTVPRSLHFLRGQAEHMRAGCGFVEIHAIASPGPDLGLFEELEGVPTHAVEMRRRITPLRDLRALWQLYRTMRRLRPTVVHSHTPKGGLLGTLAGAAVRAPVRIYHVRGLPLATAVGHRRALYRCTEWLACRFATRVVAVSHSMRRMLLDEGLCPRDKVVVLGKGSGQGVDVQRFRPAGAEARRVSRARYGLPDDALVIGFVGRPVHDKGVVELARAWRQLRSGDPRLHLAIAGGDDDGEPAPAAILAELRADPRVRFLGVVDTETLYPALDVVALPTHREGFTNVALEAGATALPIVASAVPGCVDAVQDGVTGTLVPARDAAALAAALERYLRDPELRARHGEAGRRWVVEEFRTEVVREALAAEYRALLSRAGESSPVQAPRAAQGHSAPP
jgi:glycosyltransferase involved in cell wall biosynthesis